MNIGCRRPAPETTFPLRPPESLSPPAPATPKNHSSLRVNLVCPKWDMIRCLLTFGDLNGLFEVSGLGFDADEHEAILDSAFVESLSRFPGFRNIPTTGALHLPPERDRAGIPLRATPRKAETALKSSQTVEVGIAGLAASQPLDKKRGRTMWFGCIPFFVGTGLSTLSGVARVLRPRVAIEACAVQHGSVPGRFPKTRARRAPRLRGAGSRGHHGREDTGRGVPPSGIGGVFAGFDGRAGGDAGSIECRARRRCVAVLARGRPGALPRVRGGVRRAVFGDGGAACGDRGGVRPFASSDEGGVAGRRRSGSGRHRDVDPRRSAGRRGDVLRGAARGVRRRSSASVLPALRSADGPSRPGREDVRDALWTGPGRTAPFPLPRVRRQLFPFGPGAGSGRQERHARRGKPLCGRRQFRQL